MRYALASSLAVLRKLPRHHVSHPMLPHPLLDNSHETMIYTLPACTQHFGLPLEKGLEKGAGRPCAYMSAVSRARINMLQQRLQERDE